MRTLKAALETAPPSTGLTPADQHRVAQALAASRADNTRRLYAGGWKRFESWCQGRRAQAMPAAPETVAAYLADRSAAGAAPATVALDRSALAAAHRGAGLEDPTRHEGVRQTLAGLARATRGRGRGQVAALDWRGADLVAALAGNGAALAGLRDAALIRVGSDALLRVSEMAALDWADIETAPDGAGTLTVRASKTDPEGQGHTRYLGEPTLQALARWRTAAALEDGPVFRAVRKGGRTVGGRLNGDSVRRILRARAQAAGLEGRVSGHSLRVGSAQSLAAAGAGLVELQQAGDWKSPAMPAHYARAQLAARGAVAKLRYGR